MGEFLSPIKNSEFARLNGQFRHVTVCTGQFHAVKGQALSSVPIKMMAHTANPRQLCLDFLARFTFTAGVIQ